MISSPFPADLRLHDDYCCMFCPPVFEDRLEEDSLMPTNGSSIFSSSSSRTVSRCDNCLLQLPAVPSV